MSQTPNAGSTASEAVTRTVPPSGIAVHCPADGRVVGTVADTGAAAVADACRQLRSAQPAWEELGVAVRRDHLLRWLNWLLDNEHALLTLLQSETGKSWADASVEMAVAVDVINYFTTNAEAFLAERKVKSAGVANSIRRLRVRYRPYQLVGLITPWNGPLGGPMMDVVGALVAGAAVACKPSEVTPLTWSEAVRGWHEAGGPPVLASITGRGETGAALVDEVDMVMFTGSVRTGRAIARRCAERLIPCSLELGGKDAMIVLADADVERAAGAAVWGGMMNSGQACVGIERVYVDSAVYDRFVSLVTDKVRALRQGMDAPGAFTCDIGAMATTAQVDIVADHVADAVEKGARVLVGGKRGETGNFYEPTVLVDVDHSMKCMREETFGPTLGIMRVADENEAVALANDSDYGLSSSLWTRDPRTAERISRRIEAGSVSINNAVVATFQLPLPMGGWKSSGLGARFGGAHGVLKYCRTQSVVEERFNLPSDPLWFPVSPRKSRLIARATRLLGAHDWRRRFGVKPR
jgi:acyl-CoA reductase-like NAD-dependent aldehyde dehydrogenase